MESIAWMAWTLPTAIFFVMLSLTLGVMTWLAVAYPEAERVGVLRIPTTRGAVFTSPFGRGRREAPGEGLRPHDRPYPLTPTLSPWERGRTSVAAISRLPSA